MSIKLKPITETSWLVLNDTDEDKVGLLSEIRNQYVLLVRGEKKQFIDRKAVNKFFNENVFDNLVQEPVKNTQSTYFINGFPTDFDSPHEVVILGNKLPLFSKKATSDIYYSAGY